MHPSWIKFIFAGRVRRSRSDCQASSMMLPSTSTRRSTARSLVCGFGRLGGVARRRRRQSDANACKPATGPMQFGGVIYVDSADKAARFVMDCNQTRIPILFLQNVNGFMVGKDSEQAGIIRAGRQAGERRSPTASCRRSRSSPAARSGPATTPSAARRSIRGSSSPGRTPRYAVMGGDQAANTLLDIQVTALQASRQGSRRRGAGRVARQGEGAHTRKRPTCVTPRPGCGSIAIIRPEETRSALLTALAVGDAARRRPAVSDGRVAGLIQRFPSIRSINSAISFASLPLCARSLAITFLRRSAG